MKTRVPLSIDPLTRATLLRRAALVHGFGRLGVSNAIWDKPGPLGAGEIWVSIELYSVLASPDGSRTARRWSRHSRFQPGTPNKPLRAALRPV